MRCPKLAEAVLIGEVCEPIHLSIRDVAGRHARLLQRYIDDAVAGNLVRRCIVAIPRSKRRALPQRRIRIAETAVGGWREKLPNPGDIRLLETQSAVLDALPLGLHATAELLYA